MGIPGPIWESQDENIRIPIVITWNPRTYIGIPGPIWESLDLYGNPRTYMGIPGPIWESQMSRGSVDSF